MPGKPVIALVGDDSYLQMEKLSAILRAVGKDAARIDFDGEKCAPVDVFDELRSFAMFGGTKVVVVSSADEFLTQYRDAVEDYCTKPSDSATLVLRFASLPASQRIYKIISKTGEVLKCEPPGERELPGWIIERGQKQHKAKVAPDAAKLLAELIGDDLGRLDSELAKLSLMSDDGSITREIVSSNVAFQRDQEMWEMTNALATGQVTEAVKRWRQLIQSDPASEFKAVTWLTMWLEDVRTVLLGGSAAQKLSWKYKGDRFIQFSRNASALGKPGLEKALNLLTEVDKQSKSGVGEAASNVERFLITVGRK